MRRTVATLLVVASPLLLAAPVGAREGRLAGSGNPVVVPVGPLPTATPPVPTPAAVTPSVPAPTRATAAVAATVRPAVKAVRAKTPAPAALNPAALDDAAHEAQLRADLCQARAIFCGLDRGGHYPGG